MNYVYWTAETLRLLPMGLWAVQHRNKRYLKGVYRDLVFRHMGSIAFFEEGIARVAWHAEQGHKIVLVTGTLETLGQLTATALGCELEARGIQVRPEVCGTRLLEVNGRWTGDIEGEALYGRTKARCVRGLAAKEKIDLRKSHAYGNSLLDRQLLCSAGNGHAINPSKEMATIAKEKNWAIWHWHQEKPANAPKSMCVSQEIHHNEGAA